MLDIYYLVIINCSALSHPLFFGSYIDLIKYRLWVANQDTYIMGTYKSLSSAATSNPIIQPQYTEVPSLVEAADPSTSTAWDKVRTVW